MNSQAGRPYQWCGLVLLITLAVFARVVTFDFLAWDDGDHVYHNKKFLPVSPANVISFWTVPFRAREPVTIGKNGRPYEQLWQPVPFTVWAVLSHIAPLHQAEPAPDGEGTTRFNPAVYHAASLLLHLINVALVFYLVLLLLQDEIAAAVGALAFGIHPLQVESVAWVTQFNNLLCSAFFFASLLAFLAFVRRVRPLNEFDNNQSQRSGGRGALYGNYCLCVICFVLACLSKPGGLMLPVLAVLLGCWRFPDRKRVVVWSMVPMVPWMLFVLHVNASLQTYEPGLYVVPWRRIFQAGDALAFYGWKLLLPYAQAVDYARHSNYIFRHWWGYATWIFPAVLFAAAWRWRRQKPEFGMALLVFVLGALPTIGFVPYYYHWYSTVSDRYVYIAMLGAAIALGALCHWQRELPLTVSRRWSVASCLVLVWWCLQSYKDAGHWRNTPALWTHVIAVTPRSWLAFGNLGNFRQNERNFPAAATLYQRALELNPHAENLRYNYALVEQKLGDDGEAYRQLKLALESSPGDPDVLNALAVMMAQQRRFPEASSFWRLALQSEPHNTQALTNLSVLLAMQGQSDQAAKLWRDLLKIQPDNPDVNYNLGIYLERHGQLDQAKALWERALRSDPNYSRAREALNRVSPSTGNRKSNGP